MADTAGLAAEPAATDLAPHADMVSGPHVDTVSGPHAALDLVLMAAMDPTVDSERAAQPAEAWAAAHALEVATRAPLATVAMEAAQPDMAALQATEAAPATETNATSAEHHAAAPAEAMVGTAAAMVAALEATAAAMVAALEATAGTEGMAVVLAISPLTITPTSITLTPRT